MATGTIKRFSYGQGYGFVRSDDGSEDVFIHVNETPQNVELSPGDKVSFDPEDNPRKPGLRRGRNVKLIR
jgi:cold shock protein